MCGVRGCHRDAAGCFAGNISLSPEVAGCYRVVAADWSTDHKRVTGIRALPPVIALDTAGFGRVLVPTSWRVADPPNWNRAGLSLYSQPWRWSGDTLRFDHLDRAHALGNDSVIVSFTGWGGAMTTFLARQGDGFEGYGFVGPQIDARLIRGILVRLRPGGCASDMGEALPST